MKGKKVVPGMMAGFIVAIGSWLSPQAGGPVIPAEIAAAATGLITIIISLLTPDELEAE